MDHVAHMLAMFNGKFTVNASLVKRSIGNVSILGNCQKLKAVKVMKVTWNFGKNW